MQERSLESNTQKFQNMFFSQPNVLIEFVVTEKNGFKGKTYPQYQCNQKFDTYTSLFHFEIVETLTLVNDACK